MSIEKLTTPDCENERYMFSENINKKCLENREKINEIIEVLNNNIFPQITTDDFKENGYISKKELKEWIENNTWYSGDEGADIIEYTKIIKHFNL